MFVGVPSYLFAGALIYVSYVGFWITLPSGFYGGIDMTDTGYDILGMVPPVFITIQIIGWGLQGLAIYLAVKWSREHNKKYDVPATLTS